MPNCTLPLYLQPDIESARICSSWSSYLKSCLPLTGIILILFLGLRFIVGSMIYKGVFSQSEEQKKEEEKKKETYNIWLYVIFSVILILLWILVPIFAGTYGKIEWEGYQQEKNIYINQGSTEKEALDRVASNYNSEKLRKAIRMSGNNRNNGLN
jgi:hypothetical protein